MYDENVFQWKTGKNIRLSPYIKNFKTLILSFICIVNIFM
uniref:Uncharacterized protein n=1 Tax=Anguilla anguilla TaxID=7936 RepID=A0A0E9VZC7_ANGAN